MEIQTTTEKVKPSFDKIRAQSSTSTSREEDSGSSTKGTFRTSWYILYSTGYLSLVNISYVFLAKDMRNSYKWRILNDEAYWVEVIHVYSHKRHLVGWSCPFAEFIRWACGLVWITCGGGNECGRAWADWGMTKPETVCCLAQTDINSHDSRKEWWLGEGLWWLQCFSSGVTTVLRKAIDIVDIRLRSYDPSHRHRHRHQNHYLPHAPCMDMFADNSNHYKLVCYIYYPSVGMAVCLKKIIQIVSYGIPEWPNRCYSSGISNAVGTGHDARQSILVLLSWYSLL